MFRAAMLFMMAVTSFLAEAALAEDLTITQEDKAFSERKVTIKAATASLS